MTVAWLPHPEPLELLAGTPIKGQRVTPVLAELGCHMQALVLELVVECADAEVLQGLGWEQLPCGGLGVRLWDGQEPGAGPSSFPCPSHGDWQAGHKGRAEACLQEVARSGEG